ncbi:hypothetical protein GCM10010343_37180 [Streptomyces avidinii]|nr:hypothetical protein GCM10010343_37180 [Streptomyces avidinii]
MPALPLASEPVAAAVPFPPELVVPSEAFPPPGSELPTEGDAVEAAEAVDEGDGPPLCPAPSAPFWQAVSEKLAATARAAKVSW